MASDKENDSQLEMFGIFDMDEVRNSAKRAAEAAKREQKEDEPASADKQLDELKSGPEHLGKAYESVDFAELAVHDNDFENCTFTGCHFVKAHLERAVFRNCTFIRCDFVLTRFDNATLDTVTFDSCKLMGLAFGGCNKFGFTPSFNDTLINSCVFESNRLKGSTFIGCTVRESEFLACDLTDTCFDATSFDSTMFDACIFKNADFTSAHGYAIDPFANRMKDGRFSLPEAQSFLYFMEIKIE